MITGPFNHYYLRQHLYFVFLFLSFISDIEKTVLSVVLKFKQYKPKSIFQRGMLQTTKPNPSKTSLLYDETTLF